MTTLVPNARAHSNPPRIAIHQLAFEQAAHLRLIFKQFEEDPKVIITAEETEEVSVSVEASGTHKMIGVMHSRTETAWSFEANNINVIMYPIPMEDGIVVHNGSAEQPLRLESVPNGLDVFEIRRQGSAVIYPGFWRLSDSETTVEFLLRPRRYDLILKQEATNTDLATRTARCLKRTAEELLELPPMKRVKQSGETALSTGPAADNVSISAATPKTSIRPAMADVGELNSFGLAQNQTLNVVDNATGRLEYSLKMVQYLQRSSTADVFKAIWKDGSSRPTLVVVKLFKVYAPEPVHIIDAAQSWQYELHAHRHLEHVSLK